MEKAKIIADINEEMYSLLGEIQYGDIVDLDAHWESLSDLLMDLKITGWKKPPLDMHYTFSEILKTIPGIDMDFVELVINMEELSESRGYGDPIPEDDVSSLQDAASEFETFFTALIERIKQ